MSPEQDREKTNRPTSQSESATNDREVTMPSNPIRVSYTTVAQSWDSPENRHRFLTVYIAGQDADGQSINEYLSVDLETAESLGRTLLEQVGAARALSAVDRTEVSADV